MTRLTGDLVIHDGVRLDLAGPLRDMVLAIASPASSRTTRATSTAGSLNVGGWKSAEDFLSQGGAAAELRAVLVRDYLGQAVAGGSSLRGWAMVNRGGSYHPRHDHRTASLSGVYYVDPGDPATPAPTIFETPCGEVEVSPAVGRLVLFPGCMFHRVPAYHGDRPRITVAFDVRR